MNIRDKLKSMESKLLQMQEKLVEDDKDPVKKKLNEEAVKLASIEFFGKEKGLAYIEEADLAEETMKPEKARAYVQNVLNPSYFGNVMTENIVGKYRVIFRYSKFFGMIGKHKKILTRKTTNITDE